MSKRQKRNNEKNYISLSEFCSWAISETTIIRNEDEYEVKGHEDNDDDDERDEEDDKDDDDNDDQHLRPLSQGN